MPIASNAGPICSLAASDQWDRPRRSFANSVFYTRVRISRKILSLSPLFFSLITLAPNPARVLVISKFARSLSRAQRGRRLRLRFTKRESWKVSPTVGMGYLIERKRLGTIGPRVPPERSPCFSERLISYFMGSISGPID